MFDRCRERGTPAEGVLALAASHREPEHDAARLEPRALLPHGTTGARAGSGGAARNPWRRARVIRNTRGVARRDRATTVTA
jgi:hypothetical protein